MQIPEPEQIQLKVDDSPWNKDTGPILVLAGPGTGKTHQLAFRIKNLVEKKGVKPEAITVITFTKEAAENMRRRISDEEKKDVFIDPDKRPECITTMHSLGLGIIRSCPEKHGLPEDFQVMTDSRLRRVLFRDAALLCGYGETEAKQADMARQQATTVSPGDTAAKIIKLYEVILRASKAIDYDDQILLACEVLANDSVARDKYMATCQHLLIDEYQDINPPQKRFISLLSKSHPNGLFVVGDDDQSIYTFRGGTPRYVREFHEEYRSHPGAQVLCLVESRRWPDTVLNAALSVVRKFDANRVQKPDPTFPKVKQGGTPVQVHDVATDDGEANIMCTIAQRNLPKRSVLFLIPAKQYADKIKRELRKRRIAYTHPPSLDDSGFVLLETTYSWLQNPEDNFSFRLCVEALCNSGELEIPSERSRSSESRALRCKNLASIAGLWTDLNEGRNATLCEALESRAKGEGGMLHEIYKRMDALRQAAPAKVETFLSAAAKYLRPWRNQESLMKEVGIWLEELRTHGRHAEGAVKIMTLQAAKGLEADIVCVAGLNEGILPRGRATSQELEETARLIYVSMTRAKQELHLFHARKRDASVTYLKESFALRPSSLLSAIEKKDQDSRYHQAPSKRRVRPIKKAQES
jgi:DNA helicase II / ATP-dependent DNA helicase PcrA